MPTIHLTPPAGPVLQVVNMSNDPGRLQRRDERRRLLSQWRRDHPADGVNDVPLPSPDQPTRPATPADELAACLDYLASTVRFWSLPHPGWEHAPVWFELQADMLMDDVAAGHAVVASLAQAPWFRQSPHGDLAARVSYVLTALLGHLEGIENWSVARMLRSVGREPYEAEWLKLYDSARADTYEDLRYLATAIRSAESFVATTDPRHAKASVTYSPKQLAGLLTIDPGTLNRHATACGIKTPKPKERGFRYSHANAVRIAEHIVETGTQGTREAAAGWLRTGIVTGIRAADMI